MSFLWNIVNSVVKQFDYFGWFSKDATILFLGLDNAGKTTLLGKLTQNKIVASQPTQFATSQHISMNGITFAAYDVGGHVAARRIWKDYANGLDGIIFIVDAADKNRFYESKKELMALLTMNELETTPFLILGNKIDKKGAASEAKLRKALGLTRTSGKHLKISKDERPIEVFMCSIVKGVGLVDGLKWFTAIINSR